MDKGVTCEHLNKLADVLGQELWQSKENLGCFDCGCPGPNLWICMQPNCHHIGCSEVKNDHSTKHQKMYHSHAVHMNISTERIWCYICEKEVYIRAALAHVAAVSSTVSPDSISLDGSVSSRLGSVSIAQDEDIELDAIDYDDDNHPRGLVGLQNLGNTCYMNAALQALSNTAPLTSYFLECAAAVTLLAGDKKPGLSRAYQKLVKEMWCRKTRGYVVPSGILYGMRNVHPMFRGYHQHDTQEFLRCFMDQLHEELKEPIWETTEEDKYSSDADADQEPRSVHMRRRAASSGASDAPFFARMRRKSPASASYSETRADGYLRVHEGTKHRRSASFGGTHQFAYNVYTHQFNGTSQQQGSESELSCSSEAEERYETCSSGTSDTAENAAKSYVNVGAGDGACGKLRYRSIISDVFDGKLLSSVQCLICKRVSRRVETFQDLSLPIPSREQLSVLRCQQTNIAHLPVHHMPNSHESWLWWLVSWFRSWFYGPVVSLQDCLAAFFSADELKGDNMYSCSRCNKLRNGVKTSGVIRLPEVLCVHLKRFRHELMFSAKVGARVSFPLHHLDMAPYKHPDCTSKVTRYDLFAVISHTGTAGGGHYTCAARNPRGWYTFDDHSVAPLSPAQLAASEAYVLFYRKVNPQMAVLRQKAAEILESTSIDPNDIKFYISKQWINKFYSWAEPGPIDNSDFACRHGGLRADRVAAIHRLAAPAPAQLWHLLHEHFGGGPAVSHVHECGVCARAASRLRNRRAAERTTFCNMHAAFQEQENPRAIYAISMHWFRQWQAFVRNKSPQPPPPVDNSGIITKQEIEGKVSCVLKPGSDHAQLSEELWRFFIDIYGGGPEVKIKTPPLTQILVDQPQQSRRPSRKYSESDKEEYCAKSASDANIREAIYNELQKNQSLQNINRRVRRNTANSDEDLQVNRKTFEQKSEPNGNYDSDEMEVQHNAVSTVRMENGIDSSDYDANDNPLYKHDKGDEVSESITFKNKPKSGRVRKIKRRTVK